MCSDQWQSYFLCQGQDPAHFRQDETNRFARQTIQGHKSFSWIPELFHFYPSLFFLKSVNFEMILRGFACSASHALPTRSIASLSQYNTRDTLLLAIEKHFGKIHPFLNLFPSFYFNLRLLWTLQPRLSTAFTWVGLGRSLSMFLQHQVQQETANWSMKQDCSLQVATGWAHLPLNSFWQVRSQPHGGALRPTERREALGCRGSASKDLPLHYSSEEHDS